MAANARQVAEVEVAESEVEREARKISSNRSVRENIKLSLIDSKNGRVLSREKAIERLKKRA